MKINEKNNELNSSKDENISLKKNKQRIKKNNKTPNLHFYCRILLFLLFFILFILVYLIVLIINLKKEIQLYKDILNSKVNNKVDIKQLEINNPNNITQEYIINNPKNITQIYISNSSTDITDLLLTKINETYQKNGFVNINEIESTIPEGRPWIKGQNKSREINVGFAFDPGYILRAMLTISSVIDAQKLETKLRLHFGVVEGFSSENMLKVYKLRDKIRNDVEFNFYNAKRVETELKGVNTKGSGVCAKLLLPELVPNDVERLIIFDTGDTMVLRDLSEMYNWNMENKTYCGVLDPSLHTYGEISKKHLEVYINVGDYLIDIKRVKNEKMYEKFVMNNKAYSSTVGDQNLLNDVADGKIGYIPMKFGLIAPFKNDEASDDPSSQTDYWFIETAKFKEKYPFLPKNINEMEHLAYNPVVIHQFNGKWMEGSGLTIYRRIAQYYIKLAGIWEEMCQKHPGYCIK